MQFNVPQFIEVEDKIIGPFTLKQFLFILGGAAILFTVWLLLPNLLIFIVIAIPVLILTLALAFYKVDGRPFLTYFLSIIGFLSKPRLYLWKKEEK